MPTPNRAPRAWWALLLAAALWSWPFDARADVADDARREYNEALELVDAGRIEEALSKFQRAYELVPHHAPLFNIGQAYLVLGKPVQALEAFSRYLEEGGERIDSERRKEVERLISEERAKVFALQLVVEPARAVVHLNDQRYQATALAGPLLLEPGRYAIRAELEGYEAATTTVEATAGNAESLRLVLQPKKATVELEPSAEPRFRVEKTNRVAQGEPDAAVGSGRPSDVHRERSRTAWRVVRGASSVVAGVGLGAVVYSSLRFRDLSESDRMTHDDFEGLRTLNDVGWILLAGGATCWGSSFVGEGIVKKHRRTKDTSVRRRAASPLSVSLTPTRIQVTVRTR